MPHYFSESALLILKKIHYLSRIDPSPKILQGIFEGVRRFAFLLETTRPGTFPDPPLIAALLHLVRLFFKFLRFLCFYGVPIYIGRIRLFCYLKLLYFASSVNLVLLPLYSLNLIILKSIVSVFLLVRLLVFMHTVRFDKYDK